MNVGICSWSFSGVARGSRPVTEVSDLAARWGFAHFEGAFGFRGSLAPGRSATALPGAPMPSLATLELHRFHLTDPNPRRRERALEVVAGMVDCARSWGARSISFSPGPPHDAAIEEAVDIACAALEPMLALARSFGIAVALENLPHHALGTRRGMRRALAHLKDAQVCLDLGNALLDGPVCAWIEEFADRIDKLHISDATLEDGFALRLPAGGSVPWANLRPLLRGLARPLFVEALLPVGTDECDFLASVRSATDKAMAA